MQENMNLLITDYLDIFGIVSQVFGFVCLLPALEQMKWNHFTAGETKSKKILMINWLSNHGSRLGIGSILLGFGLEFASLTWNIMNR